MKPPDRSSPTSRGDVLVAIDVGTSGARAVLFDLDGHRLAERRRSYQTQSPKPNWAEQDARAWRSASLGALAALVRGLGPGARVRAIGLTGQCPSVVPVDRRGVPVAPGMTYRDNRAVFEAAEIRARWGDAVVHRRTGHLPAAFHVGAKVLWLRRHLPDVFDRTYRFLQPRDLVALALTGEWATDGSHAAATLFYDLHARRWDPGLLAAFDLPADSWPPLHDPWEVLGTVRPSLAARLGLVGRVPVILGGADSQACALGAGVVAAGPVSEMAGSSTCLNAAVAKPLDVLAVTHYPHVVPGIYTTETGINTTGAAVTWLAGLMFGGRRGRPLAEDWARLDAEAALVAPGSDGILALPVLGDGERDDPDVRGAFTGLSLQHGRGTIVRTMMEGIAFEIDQHLDLLREAGTPVTELRVSGGGARLRTWNQIKADVLGISVSAIAGDAAGTGTAMLAGIGAGVYRDVAEATARCVHVAERREPGTANSAIYRTIAPRYRELAGSALVRRDEGAQNR